MDRIILWSPSYFASTSNSKRRRTETQGQLRRPRYPSPPSRAGLAAHRVNSAIVLIAAANERQRQGMGALHATVYAARRRLIPILITSGTTIAGLSSLAFGWTGKSLLWGPVASSIVWGLGFSTALTLWIIPLLYLATARLKSLRASPSPAANAPDE